MSVPNFRRQPAKPLTSPHSYKLSYCSFRVLRSSGWMGLTKHGRRRDTPEKRRKELVDRGRQVG